MVKGLRPPGPLLAPVIEWRARRIEDPVERLRFLRRTAARCPTQIESVNHWYRWSWRLIPVVALLVLVFIPAKTAPDSRVSPPPRMAPPEPRDVRSVLAVPEVWPVEQTQHFDVYSNGLRIENEFAVPNQPRRPFPVFRVKTSGSEAEDEPVEWRADPVGIVFHATESHQAPFEPSELKSLKRLGRNLLEYVRTQRSYHFLIDRFGRVYRIVRETDVANHAGKSIWADTKGAYINLNSGFLGISLESQTDRSNPLSQAQVHAARILTEMLRSRFRIVAANCVTHAQVSVSALNMRIGYHTDWATAFPFAQLGLPDNYAHPVASMAAFGFGYDDVFLGAAGGQPWGGMSAADRLIEERARAEGITPAECRRRLQQRYKRIISALTRMNEEDQDEGE